MAQIDVEFFVRLPGGGRQVVSGGGILPIGATATASAAQLTVGALPSGVAGQIFARVRADGWARVSAAAAPDPTVSSAAVFGPGSPSDDIPVMAGWKVAVIAGRRPFTAITDLDFSTLPKTRPSTPGLPWLNGEVLQVS